MLLFSEPKRSVLGRPMRLMAWWNVHSRRRRAHRMRASASDVSLCLFSIHLFIHSFNPRILATRMLQHPTANATAAQANAARVYTTCRKLKIQNFLSIAMIFTHTAFWNHIARDQWAQVKCAGLLNKAFELNACALFLHRRCRSWRVDNGRRIEGAVKRYLAAGRAASNSSWERDAREGAKNDTEVGLGFRRACVPAMRWSKSSAPWALEYLTST